MCMRTADKRPIAGQGYKTLRVREDGKLTCIFYKAVCAPGEWSTTRAKGRIRIWSHNPPKYYPKGFHVWLVPPEKVKRGHQLWLVEYRDVVASGLNQGSFGEELLRTVVARGIRPIERIK